MSVWLLVDCSPATRQSSKKQTKYFIQYESFIAYRSYTLLLTCNVHYITLFTQKYDANYMSASNKRRSSLFTVMPCNKTLTTGVTYYRANPTPINAESNV